MSYHIFITNIPTQGHINPTLAVVDELVKHGHQVSYAVTQQYAERVKAAGATPLLYESKLKPVVKPDEQTPEELAQQPLNLLNETIGMIAHFDEWVKKNKPDVVLYDHDSWAGRILAAKYQLPAIMLSSNFAYNEHFSIDKAYNKTNPEHPAMQQFSQQLQNYLQQLAIPNLGSEHFLDHIEKLQLLFLPRYFQYEDDKFDERYVFVGPCLNKRLFYDTWVRPDIQNPVLLISLGTAYNHRPEFYKTCIEAFTNSRWHVIMTVGDTIDIDSLGPLPTNFEVHPYVSHLDVLPHCRAIITHGSMNSTMEALFYGVPVIAIPQTPEQEATAARIAQLGLGCMIRPREVSKNALIEGVRSISNDPLLRGQVKRMQTETHKAGGAKKAVEVIEDWLKK